MPFADPLRCRLPMDRLSRASCVLEVSEETLRLADRLRAGTERMADERRPVDGGIEAEQGAAGLVAVARPTSLRRDEFDDGWCDPNNAQLLTHETQFDAGVPVSCHSIPLFGALNGRSDRATTASRSPHGHRATGAPTPCLLEQCRDGRLRRHLADQIEIPSDRGHRQVPCARPVREVETRFRVERLGVDQMLPEAEQALRRAGTDAQDLTDSSVN